jgi:ferredoxin-thioredoxin reductase catalytic chain
MPRARENFDRTRAGAVKFSGMGDSMRKEGVERLFQTLKKVQEAKGYYFNADLEVTYELLEGLIVNRERYAYMCCPCRIASNDRKKDSDIICPCVYRAPDVEEYGSCYCSLYVSREGNDGKVPHVYVPERRPPEKYGF